MKNRTFWVALFGAAASVFLAACSLLGLTDGLEQSRCMDNSFCQTLNDSFPTGDPCKLWQCIDGLCAIGGRDSDGDGFAAAECDEPGGREPDCDDTMRGISPGAQEVCGGADEDCDGSVNEGLYAFEDAILEDRVMEDQEEVSYAIRPGTLEVAVTWTEARANPRVMILQEPRVVREVANVIPVGVRDDVPADEAELGRVTTARGSAIAPLPNNEYALAYIEDSGGCQRPLVGLMRSTTETVTMRTTMEEREGFAVYMDAAYLDRGLPDENGLGCQRQLCNPHVQCRTGGPSDLRVECEGTTCIRQCLVATECDSRPAVMCTEPDVATDCNADMVNDERCNVAPTAVSTCRSAAMAACEADPRCDWTGAGTNTCIAARVTDACSSRLTSAACAMDPACTWRTTFCVLTSSVTGCPMVAQTACDGTSGCEWTGSPTPTCAGIGNCAERCICPGDAATCGDTMRRCFAPRSTEPCNRNLQCDEALGETCVADQMDPDTAFHCDRRCDTSADCEPGEDCEAPPTGGALRCVPPADLFARMISVATMDRAVAVAYAYDDANRMRETCGAMSPTVGLYANFAYRDATMSVREMQVMPEPAVKIGDTKDTAPAPILGLPGFGFLVAFTDPTFDIVFKRVTVDGMGTTASPYAFSLVGEPVLTLETGMDAMGEPLPRGEVKLALGPREGDVQQIGVVWHERCAINGDVRAQLLSLDYATGMLTVLTADPLTIPSMDRVAEQLPSIAYSEDMDAWIVTYEIENQEVRAVRLFLDAETNALETVAEEPFRVIDAPDGSTISEPSFAYPRPGMPSFGAVGHLLRTSDGMQQGFYGAEFNCVNPMATMDAGTPAP